MSYTIRNTATGTTRTWRGPIFGQTAKPGEVKRHEDHT